MDKHDLQKCIQLERKTNIGNTCFSHVMFIAITSHPVWLRWRFILHMRKAAYYEYLFKSGVKAAAIPMIIEMRLKNRLGNKLGFEIGAHNIKSGFTIYHNGPVVIHGKSIIGENCHLHGDNCIGNDGITDDCPVIGNNVDIGVGAKIIGKVEIADNIRIGAGAVVVNSFLQPGVSIGGVPARELGKKREQ